MIGLVLISSLMCLATIGGLLLLLSVIFRMQIRRFNTVVATDRLDAWESRLAALEPAEREQARATPPAHVLAAMLDLPSTGRAGLLSGWDERPLQAE